MNEQQRCIQNYIKKSKIERFLKIVNGFKPLTIFFFFSKRSILDAWKGSKYVSEENQNLWYIGWFISKKNSNIATILVRIFRNLAMF